MALSLVETGSQRCNLICICLFDLRLGDEHDNVLLFLVFVPEVIELLLQNLILGLLHLEAVLSLAELHLHRLPLDAEAFIIVFGEAEVLLKFRYSLEFSVGILDLLAHLLGDI